MTDPIQDGTPVAGDVHLGPDGQPITPSGTGTNVPDPLMNDIDAMFGQEVTASGDGSQPSGTPAIDEDGLPIAAETGKKPPEVDPFSGMTPEQQAKHFQSLYNKLENEHNQMKPEYEKYKSVAEFVNQGY